MLRSLCDLPTGTDELKILQTVLTHFITVPLEDVKPGNFFSNDHDKLLDPQHKTVICKGVF